MTESAKECAAMTMSTTHWQSAVLAGLMGLLLGNCGCTGLTPYEIHRVAIDWNSYQQCSFHSTTKHHLPPTEFETRQLMWPYNIGNAGVVTQTQQSPLPSTGTGTGHSAIPTAPQPGMHPIPALINPPAPIPPGSPFPSREPESPREPVLEELPAPSTTGTPSAKKGFRDLLDFAKPPDFGPPVGFTRKAISRTGESRCRPPVRERHASRRSERSHGESSARKNSGNESRKELWRTIPVGDLDVILAKTSTGESG